MNANKFTKNLTTTFLFTAIFMISINPIKGQLVINGTAISTGSDCYQMTPAVPTSIASIWSEDKIDLSNSFDFQFDMNFGCTDIGADGMVFVLQNISSTILGGSGGDIGYGPTFNPTIAVEFDTYDNIGNLDLVADHIAIVRDGNVMHNVPNNLAGPVQASVTDVNIEDCSDHPVRIIWNSNNMTMEVYFDCVLRLSYTGDIVNDIFGGDPMVFWGFTGSTGGKTNVQSICFNSIEGTISQTNQTVSICEGDDFQLMGSQQNLNYSWTPTEGLNDPNSSNPIASPTENITYIGTAMDQCENEFIDTFNIEVNSSEISFEILPAFLDTSLCEGETIELTIQTDMNNVINWQDGSTDFSYTISQPGSFEVSINNDCATETIINMEVEETNCMVSMPNVFTPNSDGVNDYFAPVSGGQLEIIQFKIYNRWGEVVFDETNLLGWDGTINGKSAPSDVYVYTIEFVAGNGTNENLSGDVTLVR